MCPETSWPFARVTVQRCGTPPLEEWGTLRSRTSSTANNSWWLAAAARFTPSPSLRRRAMKTQVKMTTAVSILLAGATLLFALASHAADPIHVMILDGESAGSYHQWKLVTPVLKKELDETGLFLVDVVTAPPAGGDFSTFTPGFSRYQVVAFNYDAPDERWPAALKSQFERYVREGGGFVSVHASDNAFPGWAAFNEMIGVGGWRSRTEKAGAL